jgi:hypothetical protein
MKWLAPALCGLILSTSVPALDIKASPTVINYAGTFGVTWNGAPGKPGDWLGIYTAGAPDSNPWMWVMAEAPSWTWLTQAYYPVNANYEFRLFCCNSFQKLGTSNHVWVQDPNAPQPQPEPQPVPQPQPAAALQDYSNVAWQPGPIIGGRNYSSPGLAEFDGVTFHPGGNVDYVTTPVQGPLPYGGSVKFRFRLHGGPLRGEVDGGSSGIFLHFQRAGDTWTAQGQYNCYRLWNNRDVSLTGLVGGDYEVESPLTEQHWSGVLSGCSQPEFQAALSGASVIGWTHLDSQSKGHGNTGNGVRLEVLEFTVRGPR